MIMKNAAIYARVSSEQQREAQTIKSQTAAIKEFSQREGYLVPEEWIFEDEGYSGSTLIRPGLERVRDLAAEGQIEALLIYSPDRLSRKYAYQVVLLEEFGRCGVEVVFVNSPSVHTPEEQLLVQFQGMIAEYERAQITERSRRGKRHRARSGLINVLSGAPYGYRYVKKTDSAAAYFEVIESEAEVVRMVYNLYTTTMMSIGAITRALNDRAIPTRKGISQWERSTVWALLRNPSYLGKACFGKTRRTIRRRVTRLLRLRGGYTPRNSCSIETPRSEWVALPVPALITEAEYELAQERLNDNKKFSLRHTKEPTLLQGLLVCKKCGYAFYRTSTRTSRKKIFYYRCLGSDHWRFDLLNANLKYEISRLFNLKVPVITLDFEGYNLLNQEVWLPNTGLLKQYSMPAIEGISYYFGLTIGF
jgi:site-specific DNA recombinase